MTKHVGWSLIVGLIVACGGGDGDGSALPAQARSKLQSCGLIGEGKFSIDEPEDEKHECAYRCFIDKGECSDWKAEFCEIEDSTVTPALRACLDECRGARFTCKDGSANDVRQDEVCDGEDDCDDGSDELNCPAEEKLTCDGNMTRYYPDEKCDGYANCKDGTDEAGCPAQAIFDCGDGEKVPASEVCDGDTDCENGADEQQGCAALMCK